MFIDQTRETLIAHLNNPQYMVHDKAGRHLSIFSLLGEEADRLGRECYVIGGFVRDIFLGIESKDIDCVTVGSGIELAEQIYIRLGKRHSHLSIFRNFGTAQVKHTEKDPLSGEISRMLDVEFVGARKESYRNDSRKPVVEDGTLEDDQRRRDLTINDLAICLNSSRFGELIDPFAGLADLKAGLCRTPLDPDITFSDDPLRMLRAIRFACRLNFKIVPDTFDAIARNRERIRIISAERIIDELNKIQMCEKPSIGWFLLQRSGLLPIIFPELAALSGVESREGKGHKDNFLHTITVLDNVCRMEREQGRQPNLWLHWAAIFHDLGKAKAKVYDEKLGWTFHNHDFIGQRMVLPIMRRLKLPLGQEMKYVQKLVALHMRPIHLADEGITDSAIRRVMFEAGEDTDDLMLLCEADITSKIPEKVRRFLDNFKVVRQKMQEIQEKDDYRNWTPPIDGNEIMARYHLSPSRQVGELREAQKDAILDGKCENTREAALSFLDTMAREMGLTVSSDN